MKILSKLFALSLGFLTLSLSINAVASEAYAVPGVRGYDLVSYHTGTPVMGSGRHVAEHDGVSYLFSSEKNQEMFVANTEKYLPAYGGYCAFGASVGKKFFADPTAWKIVEGKLYMNLDHSILERWSKDIPGKIAAGDANWDKIKDLSWTKVN